MPSADVRVLADAFVPLLEGWIGETLIESKAIEIERVWEVTVDLGTFDGRLIKIFPTVYINQGPSDRKGDNFDMQLSFVMLERYAGDLADDQTVPKSWVDERVDFFQEYIFENLVNFIGDIDGVKVWAQVAEPVSVYDFPRLTQHKVFWSEFEITFRKIKQ